MDVDVLEKMDPKEIGIRLREARKARGLTQQDAADHINVTRTTITAIEKGERRIQPSEFGKLVALFGRSISDFIRKGEPVEAFTVQLRATLPSQFDTGKEISLPVWEFQRLCEDYVELEYICETPLRRKYPAPYEIAHVSLEIAAEDVATAERNRLGLGDGPLLNLREILENDVGIRVFYMDMPSKVGAMFAYTEKLGGCIAINIKHPEERRRWSMAHDYGHFLSNRYQPEITIENRYQRQPESERFADAFARSFLMPSSGLSRRFNEVLRSKKDGRATPADLCTMAYFYYVSVEAFTRRLEELKLISYGFWDLLISRGFKVREAQTILKLSPHQTTDSMNNNLPARYLYLAMEALREEKLSEGQFAQFIRKNRIEARQIIEEICNNTNLKSIDDEKL